MLTGRYRAGRRLQRGRHSVITVAVITLALLAAVALPGRSDASTATTVDATPATGLASLLEPVDSPDLAPDTGPEDAQPYVFDPPPPGGLAMGVANTGSIDALIDAQPFDVKLIAALDSSNQRWLLHIVGAPPLANTLTAETLTPNMIIVIRRSAPEPAEVSPAETSGTSLTPGGTARITYYFCERGSNPAGWGDGGGFCGAMRSGQVVYDGAAACSAAQLGQRFRIVGDPTERTYTCEDTGSAVHGNHRDIWFRNSDEALRWYAQVGTHAEIVIVE